MKTKILYIINNLKQGGAQKNLLEVIGYLDKEKFEPWLAILEKGYEDKCNIVSAVTLGINRIYDFNGIKGLFKLIKLMRREKFHIVHSYLFNENIIGSIAGKIAKTPVIITSRRDTGIFLQKKFYYFLMYRLTNLLVDKIICVSKAVKKAILAKEKVNFQKIEVIYNGIDIKKFQVSIDKSQIKSQLGIKEDELVIGIIANFNWVKGHKNFLEAAKAVLKEVPNTKFLFIGDGILKNNLQSIADSLQIADRIIFTGVRNDIPELLSIIDVSINASLSEGMSNAILQSMAAGIPVVATAVDGNLETVIDGVTGMLVPPKSSKDMAEAIIKILKNKELAKEMGSNAKRIVKEKFTLKIMTKNMERLYKSLLEPKIAFIFSQFPSYDETFILREIKALKKAGLNFLIFSLKKCKDKIIQEDAKEFIKDTLYIPFISGKVILACIHFMVFYPIRFWKTFFYVVKGNLKSFDFLIKTLALFPKSVLFAYKMKKLRIKHLHGQWATHPTTIAVIVSRLSGIPFSFTGHAHDIYVDTTMLPEKIKEAEFVTTCTQNNKEYLLKIIKGYSLATDIKKTEDKIVVSYHGVDISRFKRANELENGRDGKKFKILSVGSLLECKGFDVLIDACKILKDKEVDFECVIAGGGPLEKRLKAQVANCGLRDYVKFTGYVTQDKLLPYYKRFDVFALPVKLDIHWGIPNVLLEAMASSMPVITTGLPSVPELIKNGKTGFIISEKNPNALAELLINLYQDRRLKEDICRAGFEVIKEKFDIVKNSKSLTDLFSKQNKINARIVSRTGRLNILYLIPSLEVGGAEQVVINLAKRLDRNRFKPIVCCLDKKGGLAYKLEDEGVEVITLDKKGAFDIGIISKIVKVMKKYKIDIIHTHLWGANFWGRLAARIANVKVIIATEHNVDTWKNWFYFMCDKWLSRKTGKIIAVSNSVKEFYVSKGISQQRIEVVYNGIEIEKSQSHALSGTSKVTRPQMKQEFGIENGEIVLAIIGRLVPQKGHQYFIQALKDISAKHKVKGLIIGSGPEEEKLKKYSRDLGLDGGLVFTGLRKNIPELLGIIDVLVMPSLREGLPITLLEAMSSGVPVVATKVGGVPEVVIDGQTGILVEPNNHNELKQAIIGVIENPDLKNTIGINARKHVEDKFSIKNMINKTQNLYENLYSNR